jgi:predicted Zn finger-like uncharacterized protein
MKISCQSCQSKYNVADEKVQGKVVKIRCRKCGATIVVDGNASAGTNGSAGAAGPGLAGEAGGDGQWHVNVSETDQRSMSLAELVDAYNSSVVTQETYIWTDGMDDWKPLGEVDAVVSALHAAAGSAAAAPAETEHEDQPTQAFSYDQAAAAGYGSSFDDRRAAAAAPEPEPAPEPRRAAVAKPRGGRDLFGESAAGTDEVQTSAPSMAQAQSMARGGGGGGGAAAAAASAQDSSSMTGERNENSVLFSLAALTKNSGPADVPPPPTGTKDDSGLIDLKALAMKTQSTRPVAPKVAEADLFSAPLGFTPPPLGAPVGAFAGPSGPEAEPKSKLPLFIVGSLGVLALLIGGVMIGVKIAGSPAPAPVVSVAPVVPTATAEPTATASATAEASATAAPSATAKPKPQYHAMPGTPGVPKPSPTGGPAPGPGTGGSATPTPAPPKKASGCEANCAGDLMCLMKCSTH